MESHIDQFDRSILVGREDSRTLLLDALSDLSRGMGRTVLIEGDAGIGKSWLIDSVLRVGAEHGGIRIITGNTFGMAPTIPFEMVTDLLDALGVSAADHLHTERGSTSWPSAGTEVLSQVRKALAATDEPLVVIGEDIHTADEASLGVLREVAKSTKGIPVLLTMSARPTTSENLRRFLSGIERMGADVKRLEPLHPQEVEALLGKLLGKPPSIELLEFAEGAAGNPLLLNELIRGLEREDAIIIDSEGQAQIKTRAVPSSLKETVGRRLADLDRQATSALRSAAVLGTSFRIEELATLEGLEFNQMSEIIESAYESGLLTDDESQATFRHNLVRDVIYNGIPESLRAAKHLHVGRTLINGGAPAPRAAAHFAVGGAPGDLQAVKVLDAAATEVAPWDPSQAAEWIERALELTPPDDTRSTRLLVSLSKCLLWRGDFDAASDTAYQVLAAPGAVPSERAEARYVLGRVLAYQGRIAESVREVEAALEEMNDVGPLRGQLLADLALRRGLHGRLDESDDAARRALVAGETLGDPLTVCTARCAMSWNEALRGNSEKAVEFALRAVRQPRRRESVEPIQSRLYLGFAKLLSGDLTGARLALDEVVSEASDVEADWVYGLAHSLAALIGFCSGDWDQVEESVRAVLIDAEAGGTVTWMPMALASGALVSISRGDSPEAENLLARARSIVAAAGGMHLASGLIELGHSELLVVDGEPRAAAAARVEAIRNQIEFGATAFLPIHVIWRPEPNFSSSEINLLRPALRGLKTSPLTEAAGAVIQTARAGGVYSEDLVSRLLEYGMAPFAARLLEFGASDESPDDLVLATSGERALALYEEMGAVRDSARLRSRLRQLGLKVGARGGRSRPATGWKSLTPAEIRVVRLVTDGLSNPEIADQLFISRRTVESHVSNALRKVSVSSRVELALEAKDHLQANAENQ